MKKFLTYVILFAVIGLIVGYLLFGKIAGEYVNNRTIFGISQNAFKSFGRNVSGLMSMKQTILVSVGIGAIVVFVIKFIRKYI